MRSNSLTCTCAKTLFPQAPIFRVYGPSLPADRRTELRQVIARIQARYFGPGATDIDEELDQVVRNWAREATSRA